MPTVSEKVNGLPLELQQHVDQFVDALLARERSDAASAEGGPSDPDVGRPSLVRLVAAMPVQQRREYLAAAMGNGEKETEYDRDWVDLDEDTEY